MRRWIVLVLVLVAGPAAADGGGDLLEQARERIAELDYDGAIPLLEQAEAAGDSDRAGLIEIVRSLAEAHAALGRADAAETAFRRLLALEPAAELPAGSSPKLTAPFTAAREFLGGRSLSVQCRRERDAATLIVRGDPLDMVAGARLLGPSGERHSGVDDVTGHGRIPIPLPPAHVAAACAALDQHGNELARTELLATAPAAAPDPVAPAPVLTAPAADRPARPIYARWWLWGAAAGVSAGVAAYYGLEVASARDDLDALHAATMEEGHTVTYADALAVEERGRDAARNANIALGVTAALSAVSVGLLIHQLVSDGPPPAETDTRRARAGRLGATPVPGGAGVSLTVPF